MLSDEVIDMLSERLVERMQEGNIYVLKKIGKAIKEIGSLNKSEAQQLAQILKYGGSYQEITYKLAQITGLNVKEIREIFEEVAKQNQQFAKQFYDYRGIDFIPYEQNKALQKQVKALSKIAIGEFMDLSRTSALGIVRTNELGKKVFVPLKKAYFEIIDEAVLNVGQGKDTFDNQMYKIIKEVGSGGLKVQYESGAVRRLDSAVRMNLKEGLRNMSNELQHQFGEEFKADGVEISVHGNPAVDHALLQGRQFSNDEYDILNAGLRAKSYDGVIIPADDRRRPISTLNCYHYIFSIVLGVSKPNYTNKELQKILDDNEKGFELDGKHYTLYEGTQLQRKLETEIRKQKDIQIMGVESGNKKAVEESQQKISQLTMKYKELSQKSGLSTRMERMRVSGYRRRNANKMPGIYNFERFRDVINNKSADWLKKNFDYKDFISEYNKFYNSIGNKEIQETLKELEDWHNNSNKSNEKPSHPIGQLLNKKTGYDKLPELINEEKFGDMLWEDEEHLYRGINGETIEDTKKYIEEFKKGKYYAGIGAEGNGTYATENYDYALRYANRNKEGILKIMPKENAKVVEDEKITTIKWELLNHIKLDDKSYYNFSRIVFLDNGYLAQILGYDIVNKDKIKIILNRGAIKVVE